LARFVYMDEAGTSNKAHEPWLVVGGVIVHGDHQLDNLYNALAEILQKHLPGMDDVILHTCDIYGGNGPVFDKDRHPEWTFPKRAAILDDLAALPSRLNLWVTTGALQREGFPHTFDEKPEGDLTKEAQVCAYVSCLIEIDFWMRQNAKKENCMLIVENNDRAKKLIKETQQFFQDPRNLSQLGEGYEEYFPLQRVREDPAFQEKRSSHPLVLADFISFIFKRYRMKDKRITSFYDPWRNRHAMMGVKLPSRRHH